MGRTGVVAHDPGRQVEGDGDRRELALMVDGERRDPVAEFVDGAKRHLIRPPSPR